KRSDQNTLRNFGIVPASFAHAVEILPFDVRWLARNLCKELEKCHYFRVERRTLEVQGQFSGKGLLETEPSENFQMLGRTTVGDIDYTDDQRNLFLAGRRQRTFCEHRVRE